MSMDAGFSRRRWLTVAVAALAAAGGAGLAWRRMSGDSAAQAAFWQRQFRRPDEAVLAMSDFRGKPLLLNFWATWCPPCIEEMPLLESFFNQNKEKGWQVLGLAADQDDAVRRFLARSPLSYPIGLAGYAGIELSRTLGNEGGGLPYTVFFDAAGRVLHHKIGRLSTDDLQAWTAAQS